MSSPSDSGIHDGSEPSSPLEPTPAFAATTPDRIVDLPHTNSPPGDMLHDGPSPAQPGVTPMAALISVLDRPPSSHSGPVSSTIPDREAVDHPRLPFPRDETGTVPPHTATFEPSPSNTLAANTERPIPASARRPPTMYASAPGTGVSPVRRHTVRTSPRYPTHSGPRVGDGVGTNAFVGAQRFHVNPNSDRQSTMRPTPDSTHHGPPFHGPSFGSYEGMNTLRRTQMNEGQTTSFASLSRSSVQPFANNYQAPITHDPSAGLRATSAHGIHPPISDRQNTMQPTSDFTHHDSPHLGPPHHGSSFDNYGGMNMHRQTQMNEGQAISFANLSRSSVQPFANNHQRHNTHNSSGELRTTSAHGIHPGVALLDHPMFRGTQMNEEQASTFSSFSRSSVQPLANNTRQPITHNSSSELQATFAHGVHQLARLNDPNYREILADMQRRIDEARPGVREIQAQADPLLMGEARAQQFYLANQQRDLIIRRNNRHFFSQHLPRTAPDMNAIMRRRMHMPHPGTLRPIPPNYVHNLPRVPIDELGPGQHDRRCPICHHNYAEADPETGTSEHPVRLPCSHVHGHICLATWFNTDGLDANRQSDDPLAARISPSASRIRSQAMWECPGGDEGMWLGALV